MQSAQELVQNIDVCLPFPLRDSLFPVDVEDHLPLWALLSLSSEISLHFVRTEVEPSSTMFWPV